MPDTAHTKPFCLRCGAHHTHEQRHRRLRAWLLRRRVARATAKR